jgi:DNA invertase Pin-like site-specific DNA recombinase
LPEESCGCGDVLIVTKPDRLARSTADSLRIVEET